ncbi:unnamed protein product [Dovyalis caffra]|uniref:NLP1-9 GAF domain-containing protein n=1 Tax=Dovyalis caffra TaxID=77055 RepID=A0AAV1QMP1_9ROSI|nr:unnamed protein product [Dovyalis caffra]
MTTAFQPFLLFPHSQQAYRGISTLHKYFEDEDLVDRVFSGKVPKWTSNILYYKDIQVLTSTKDSKYNRQAIANFLDLESTIAFSIFDSHDSSCRGVLEIMTMIEKHDFDFETEKVFKALRSCRLVVRLRRCKALCILASNDIFEEGQGVVGKTLSSNLTFFETDVKEYHITEYPLVLYAHNSVGSNKKASITGIEGEREVIDPRFRPERWVTIDSRIVTYAMPWVGYNM